MFVTVVIALAMTLKLSADQNTGASAFLGPLTAATSAELPAKAADLVVHADAKNLKQTTIDVVKAAIGLNPAAAPAIVGSIARSSPTMAGTAAATAVVLVPNQAAAIARAAAAAAPGQAGSIVEAICRVSPGAYQIIAAAVAEAVPGAGKQILAGIAAAIPELKDAINQTLAAYDGKIPSVSMVLTQVAQAVGSTTTSAVNSGGTPLLPRGPSTGPANLPIGTPIVNDPGTGVAVPTGGRPPLTGYVAP